MCDEKIAGTGRPPLLHDQLVALSAPTQVWSDRDGTMGGGPLHGIFHGDWRFVRGVELLVDGAPVEHIGTTVEAGCTIFRAVARGLDAAPPDPRVIVERMREVTPGALVERATVVNGRDVPIDVVIQLVCDVGFAPTAAVGEEAAVEIPVTVEHGVAVAADRSRTLRVLGVGGEVAAVGERIVVTRRAAIEPGGWSGLAIELSLDDRSLAVRGFVVDPPCTGIDRSGRPWLDRWSECATADLEDLLLDAGHGPFLAAGAPWHLTMVARDALVAARFLLPLSTTIAEGTLRTLAARQGLRRDAATGEEPGRILHELPQHRLERHDASIEQHPRYAGSVDATPLWILLLHRAWRAGLPLEAVRELRTALHAALGWLLEHTGEGFLSCPGESRSGLSDGSSPDPAEALRLNDGTQLAGEISAARLQGLACLAAVDGAELLDALGDDGASLRAWASRLRRRFRAAFWVERGEARFPAMAIDSTGAQLDWLSADIGHLIGTTLLSADEELAVARLLLDERLSSGFGLRTMASDAPGYWPMAHHRGAIWPVDTAIAIEGLLGAGLHAEARALAEQLERAADAFGGRVPQTYAGYGLADSSVPIPYPGACSPHAASTASVVIAQRALSGLRRRGGTPLDERRLHAVEPPLERDPAPPPARRPSSAPAPGPSVVSPPEPEPIFATGGAVHARRPHLRLVDPWPPPER